MPASYSGISNVSAGDVASASNLNQYKESLEGARDFVPILWATANNNIIMRVGDAAGANYFDIQDYAGVSQFKVDSNGNITTTQTLTSTKPMRLLADISVANTTTLADITGLSFAIGANEIWALDIVLLTVAGSVGDMKFGWTYPASCTMRWGNRGDAADNAGNDPTGAAMPTSHNWDGPITWTPAFSGHGADIVPRNLYALVTNGANAGTLQLQFSQLASDATATYVKADSYIIATKVS